MFPRRVHAEVAAVSPPSPAPAASPASSLKRKLAPLDAAQSEPTTSRRARRGELKEQERRAVSSEDEDPFGAPCSPRCRQPLPAAALVLLQPSHIQPYLPSAPAKAVLLAPRGKSSSAVATFAQRSSSQHGLLKSSAAAGSLKSFFTGASPQTAAPTEAAATSASSSCVAAAASPLVQTELEDHLRSDYDARQAKLTPAQKLQRKRQQEQGRDQSCSRCMEPYLSQTPEDHDRKCPKVPPPICIPKGLVLPYVRAAPFLKGGDLIRIRNADLDASRGRAQSALHSSVRDVLWWLDSVLQGRDGWPMYREWKERIQEEDAKEFTSDEWTLLSHQELWILRKGDSVACAVLVNTDVQRHQLSINTERVELRSRAHQTSLSSFLSPKLESSAAASPPAAAQPASSASASAVASAPYSNASAPLFGVDKIASHASFRFGADPSSRASAAATPQSVASAVLLSILGEFSRQHTTCVCKVACSSAAFPSTSQHSRTGIGASPCAVQVAFSTPRREGMKLAARFTGTQQFLTYNMER
jgi:hypothetical protein